MGRYTTENLIADLAAISPRLSVHRGPGYVAVMYEAESAPTGLLPFRGPIVPNARRPSEAWRLFQARRAPYGF